jgi:hypothetical protein
LVPGADAGSDKIPVYFKDGRPAACNDVVAKKLGSGTSTSSLYTVGGAANPVYFHEGIPVPCEFNLPSKFSPLQPEAGGIGWNMREQFPGPEKTILIWGGEEFGSIAVDKTVIEYSENLITSGAVHDKIKNYLPLTGGTVTGTLQADILQADTLQAPIFATTAYGSDSPDGKVTGQFEGQLYF